MAITSILKLYCNCFLLSEGLLAILLPGRLTSWPRMCVCAFKVPRCNDKVPSRTSSLLQLHARIVLAAVIARLPTNHNKYL
ncbi:hypothetical protein C8J57DRAFT_1338163, partial [Mycena rebaudengoi]